MIGTTLAGRYEILAELGRGGMGVVYRAKDPLLGREVAVKIVPPTSLSLDAEERFQREAQLVARMDHPGIVAIHDIGRHDGTLFFVMPLLEGRDLRGWMREGLRLDDVLEITAQVADALDYSHERGVVHRDVKPENVMVSRGPGGDWRVRVMDFGLARSGEHQRITRTGALVGTVVYFSPEQVEAGDLDGRSDVYSLGAVLYELLVGEAPFIGDIHAVLYGIAMERPAPPSSRGIVVPSDVEELVIGCLAKVPGDRPQRAREVATGLRRCLAGLTASDLERPLLATRPLPASRPAPPPLAGREEPLGELQRRLDAAVAGECHLVLLGGEPGIGKTRLLEELERGARVRHVRVLHGDFTEGEQASAFQGFAHLVQDAFRPAHGSTPSGSLDLADLAAELVALFPVLGEIPELRGALSDPQLHMPEPAGPTRTRELLALLLARLGRGRPLVAFMEGLHAAPAAVDALPFVFRRLGHVPLLIVGTYRTTDVGRQHPVTRLLGAFAGGPGFAHVVLKPLAADEHRRLVESALGGRVSEELAARLHEASDGNPFFARELVRSLRDSGAIAAGASGVWSDGGRLGTALAELPDTIQQAMERRVERLSDERRQLLATASVLGRTFDVKDLEALAPDEDLDEPVEELVRGGFLEEDRDARGDHLRFTSGVLRDVLYAALPRRRRRSLHRRHAERLLARGRTDRFLPQLVYHFTEADDPRRAVEHALRLASRSLASARPADAIRAARVVLDHATDDDWDGDPTAAAQGREALARALAAQGDAEAALAEAGFAQEEFRRQGRTAEVVRIAVFAAHTAWTARRPEAARRVVDAALPLARSLGDFEPLDRLLALGATLASLRSEYSDAQALLAERERLQRPASAPPPRGGRVVVPVPGALTAREPADLATVDEEEVLLNVFETLLSVDADGNLVPRLCEHWESTDGGRSFELRLRGGVRFHDGSDLDAEAVRDALERATRRARGTPAAALLALQGAEEFRGGSAARIAGLSVTSPLSLRVDLREPLPIFPALLTAPTTAVARHTGAGAFGTGLFRVAAWTDDEVQLVPWNEHWSGTAAHLAELVFRRMDAAGAARAFVGGEVDLARGLRPEDAAAVLRDPRLRSGVVEAPRRNTYFALFRKESPRVADPRVRRAVAGVVPVAELVWRTLGRGAVPAAGLIPPGILAHSPGRRRATLDDDDGRGLLLEAGVDLPLRLRAAVHPVLQDRAAPFLRALIDAWSRHGIEVEVASADLPAFLSANEDPEHYDLRIGRWNADYDDPDDFTYGLFHSRDGVMRRFWSSAAFDVLASQARQESRPAERERLYGYIEEMLLAEDALIPLFHDVDVRIGRPGLGGLRLRGTPPYVDYAGLYVGDAASAPPRFTAGGTVHVPVAGPLPGLDPATTSTVEQGEVGPNIFETLTRDVEGAGVVPWLAESVVPELGGRRFRFRLRGGVRFHDGRPLSARDVRASFERLLRHPRSSNRPLLLPVRGARALHDGTASELAGFVVHSAREFSIELHEPCGFFPALLGFHAAAIVPEGSGYGEAFVHTGTGPFRLQAVTADHRVILSRHVDYWREGLPRAEGLVFHLEATPERILSEFQEGRLALASDLYPADVERLLQDPGMASGYRETPRLSTYFAAFNTRRGPMSDRDARRRLAGALDVSTLVRETLGRAALPAVGLIPPGLLGHDAAEGSRLDAFRRISGTDPTLGLVWQLAAAVHPVYRGRYASLATRIREDLLLHGIDLTPQGSTMDDFLAARRDGEVDLVVQRWLADYPDADSFAYGVLHREAGTVGHICGTAEIDELIARGRAEVDPALRHATYREIEQIVARDVLLMPLFHEQVYRVPRPELEGLRVSISSPPVAYEDLWLSR